MNGFGQKRGEVLTLPQAQQPAMQLAAPLNDIQLIALVAAHRPELPAAEAVGWASDILIEAVKAGRKVQESIRAWQTAQG